METLISELKERISIIANDKYIDEQKRAIIIRENKRIINRCQQISMDI